MTLPRRCLACGASAAVGAGWRCGCGAPWALEPFGRVPSLEDLRDRPPGIWRYREALPVAGAPVSLGEGGTPLVPARDGGLHFKVESVNPTGSFKDRGAAVLLTAARAAGAGALIEDSSGNAGAAVAAYAARAGIEATIYVPDAASPGKLAQLAAYGARVVRVAGSREAVAAAAQAAPGRYASHCWDPFFFHGTKTIAYELWEALEGRGPSHVIAPVGHGTMLLGLWLGFRELVQGGALARTPRLVGVQSAACAPLAGPALGLGTGTGDTVAEGIRVREPVRPAEIRRAVQESGGRFMVVGDAEIAAARTRLGREGLFVEPTAAVAPAAACRLLEEGAFAPSDLVVVPLTGHGLKAPTAA
jgi:threonine synthase